MTDSTATLRQQRRRAHQRGDHTHCIEDNCPAFSGVTPPGAELGAPVARVTPQALPEPEPEAEHEPETVTPDEEPTVTDTADVAGLKDELAGVESARAVAQEQHDAAQAELEGFHQQVRDGDEVDLPELGRAEQDARIKGMRLQHLQRQGEDLAARLEVALTRQERAEELSELQRMGESLAAAQDRVDEVKESVREALKELRTAVEDAGSRWGAFNRKADQILPFLPPDARSDEDHVTGACSRSGQGPYKRLGGINSVSGVTLNGAEYRRVTGSFEDVKRSL